MEKKQRLDSLTSLRFLAAVMIVFHHSIGYELFGFGAHTSQTIGLGQGVSFFFVLSGFILAYVYPSFHSFTSVVSFLRARVARVWPALAFSMVLAIVLLSLDVDSKTAFANIFMINSWVPYPQFFYSYNAPSWSISTEFFFYIFFPILIYKWKSTWFYKFIVSIIIVAINLTIADTQSLPFVYESTDRVSLMALIYISPLTRILEFIFGMIIASLYESKKRTISWTSPRATFYESLSFVAIIVSMMYSPRLGHFFEATFATRSFGFWISTSGAMFASGLLIFVVAISRGKISKFLSVPTFVLLGEISYSMYLLHQIFLRYYKLNFLAFPAVHNFVSFGLFWVFLLLSSYLTWQLVEMPLRTRILGHPRNVFAMAKASFANTGRSSIDWFVSARFRNYSLSIFLILICIIASIFDHSSSTYIKRKGIEISPNSFSFFTMRGDFDVAQKLLDVGLDVDSLTSTGSTALIDAAWSGKEKSVRFLLDAKANVNVESATKYKALNAAINQKHDDIALLLLDHGADSNHQVAGSTALIEASWQGNLPLVKSLLKHGADVNFANPTNGVTALKAATSNGKSDVAEVLVSFGAH